MRALNLVKYVNQITMRITLFSCVVDLVAAADHVLVLDPISL